MNTKLLLMLSMLAYVPLSYANIASSGVIPYKNTPRIHQATGGKMIGYLPGFPLDDANSPLPDATVLAQQIHDAGYNYVIAAFAEFDTPIASPNDYTPATLVSNFANVTQGHINALHAQGIPVIISIGGGGSGNNPAASDFDSAITAALTDKTNPLTIQQFESKFVQSTEDLVDHYQFDGVDIDIEHGLTPTSTTHTPSDNIQVLADIINQLHQDRPNLLISLAPQSDGVTVTRDITDGFGNYSKLLMDINDPHGTLSWVGIQIYNTGGVNSIDGKNYPNTGTDPDVSVVMADDVLENWPAGSFAYKNALTPDQLVLGYPANTQEDIGDARPNTLLAVIKNAIACLRSGSDGCNTYKPHAVNADGTTSATSYPTIGGVFDWQIMQDRVNYYQSSQGYGFAYGLTNCVLKGNCA